MSNRTGPPHPAVTIGGLLLLAAAFRGVARWLR